MLHAARIARDLDSTVPAALDLLSYPHIPKQQAYSGFGLLGLNSYYGWYKGKTRTRSTAKLSDLPTFLADMRRMYPRQAMMITEFGAEATFDGPADVKETFAFQSRYVDRTLDIVERTDVAHRRDLLDRARVLRQARLGRRRRARRAARRAAQQGPDHLRRHSRSRPSTRPSGGLVDAGVPALNQGSGYTFRPPVAGLDPRARAAAMPGRQTSVGRHARA